MGKSGIGKTTLVKFLMGQLQSPMNTLFYKGKDMASYSEAEIQSYRQTIGVIFQDYKLLDWKNVSENIRYPLDIEGWYDNWSIQKKIEQVIQLTHLTSKKESSITNLSWWEKQRVSIARAIIHKPTFLIADEPTGNLDHPASLEIMDTLMDIHSAGNTILCITHDATLVSYCKNKNPAIRIVQL